MATTHIRMLYTQNRLLLDTLIKFYENKDHLNKMVSIINGVSKLSLRIIDWFVTNYSKKYFVIYNLPSSHATTNWCCSLRSGDPLNLPSGESMNSPSQATANFHLPTQATANWYSPPLHSGESLNSPTVLRTSGDFQNIQQPPDTRFKVYNEYKLKLKAYGKVNFDPFCRWSRITIPFNEDYYMETTIGQLNFFKWAIENQILDYIDEHYEDIEADMTVRNSTSKNKKSLQTDMEGFTGGGGGKTRKKREELSVSACKCIKTENVPIVIHF
jgi:hypothetical protein